ncbi:MAG: radical SAM protein [Nitrospinaceae bacterium]|jgi:organic radical activating enzyme
MINIFAEANCNRYVRDECQYCHVYEPLSQIPKSDWHLMPEQAQIMVDKIRQMEVFHELAKREINLTGGEPSQNPYIVEIFKVFRKITPNVRIHTNLDINSEKSQRWQRLVEIMKLSGRVDFTLYPTVWESRQRSLLAEILRLQDELIVNMIFEKVSDLLSQIEILITFFGGQEKKYQSVLSLLSTYRGKLINVLAENPDCSEVAFLKHMEGVENYICADNFTFGLNMIPGFYVDKNGGRSMNAQPFPKDFNLLECTIPRGTIEIVTVQQTGEITPCCDVGNLKCQPKFGNLLLDSPEKIMRQIEVSRKKMVSGTFKNHQNINNGKAGEWVEEGIPPYCV